LLGWEFREQVGRVVRIHFFKDVSGALTAKRGKNLDSVVLWKFLEDVGELFIVERDSEFLTTLRGELVHHVGEVGGAQIFHCCQQAVDALLRVVQ
jgi:hypothetical protein